MLKIWLKKTFFVLLEIALIGGALWFVAQKKGIRNISQIEPAIEQLAGKATQQAQPFPELKQSETKTFSWTYKGFKYSLPLTLYGSVDAFYGAQPKTYSYAGTLSANWQDQYYSMFLKPNDQDKTISDLAAQLQALGKKHGLGDDQIVELTMAFVQAIPYDDARAKQILAGDSNTTMQYPYETLFRQLGVCSDKSLLSYALLKQMGYGVALLAYEQDNHMALGIQCPQNYSTYGSGYCYAETTSVGNKIGIIPSLDSQSNKTVDLAALDPTKNQQINLQQLGQVTIYDAYQGREYDGIIATQKIESEIAELSQSIQALIPKIAAQKTAIASQQQDLQDLKSKMDNLKNSQNVSSYNALVPKYNSMVENYQKAVKNFNNAVNLYNSQVARYNLLITQ
ncbi:MAG TPA: transglutaminase-like domain-containing protein [Patescibacteria group bacterium]